MIFHLAEINEGKSNVADYYQLNTELSKQVFDEFYKVPLNCLF